MNLQLTKALSDMERALNQILEIAQRFLSSYNLELFNTIPGFDSAGNTLSITPCG